MTDDELLDSAAKAIGYDLHINLAGAAQLWKDGKYVCFWNPLEDDSDAMRLAVQAGIAVTPYPIYEYTKHSVIAKQYRKSDMMRETNPTEVIEIYRDNPEAATRRAIVRAAALVSAR